MLKTRPRKRKNLTGVLFALFAFGLLIAVLTKLTIGVIDSSPVKDVSIPGRLAGMVLTKTISGPEALQQLSELHGKDVQLASGYIAHYNAQGRETVVYVGAVRTEEQARRLNEAMTQRIGKGNRYFTNLRTLAMGELTISRLDGADGLAHYYYQKANKVIWLGIGDQDPEAVLREAIKVAW